MVKDESVTYGRLPYWNHNMHTAICTERIDFPDGTADLTLTCECGTQWHCSEGVDHDEHDEEADMKAHVKADMKADKKSSSDGLTSEEVDG